MSDPVVPVAPVAPVAARPRRVLASLGASAAWLLPPVAVMIAMTPNHSENSMGLGLAMLFTPVAMLVGAVIWYLVGRGACSRDLPGHWQFVRRAAGIFSAVGAAFGLRVSWGGPLGELIFIPVMHALVLGATAVPAALVWWWLGIRPLRGAAPASG